MNVFDDHLRSNSQDKSFLLYHGSYLEPSVLNNSVNSVSNVSASELNTISHSPSSNKSIKMSSTTPTTTATNQRNPFIGRSLCVVCGDRARGCNFGAITCASCKEFFRRNAFKVNKLKCYFQCKCEINIYSRRFCAACRLSKCYQIGMKSDYIMSETEKSKRQMKIIERKLTGAKRPLTDKFKQFDPSQRCVSVLSDGSTMELAPDEMWNSDGSHNLGQILIQNQLFNVKEHLNGTLHDDKDMSNDSSEFASDSSTLANDIKLEDVSSPSQTLPYYGAYENDFSLIVNEEQSQQLPSFSRNTLYNRDWQESESVKKLLRNVKIIRESSFYPTKFHILVRAKERNRSLNHHGVCKLRYLTSIVQIMQGETIHELPIDQNFIDLIRIAEIVTFNFIKMCKKLYVFQALSQEDQISLVKGGVMETLLIWSMMTINLEKECWEALDLERNIKFSLKMELLKEANPQLYEKHRSYALSFEPEWRFNDNIMSLLIAIALFNPNRANINNVEIIRNEQQAYCDLLKQYLDTLYEDSNVDKMYKRLLKQLELTVSISECHVKAYFDVSANEITKNGIGGLIMEIFDLNN